MLVFAFLDGASHEVVRVIHAVPVQARKDVARLLPRGDVVEECALGDHVAVGVRLAREGRGVDKELPLLEPVIGASLHLPDREALYLHALLLSSEVDVDGALAAGSLGGVAD